MLVPGFSVKQPEPSLVVAGPVWPPLVLHRIILVLLIPSMVPQDILFQAIVVWIRILLLSAERVLFVCWWWWWLFGICAYRSSKVNLS